MANKSDDVTEARRSGYVQEYSCGQRNESISTKRIHFDEASQTIRWRRGRLKRTTEINLVGLSGAYRQQLSRQRRCLTLYGTRDSIFLIFYTVAWSWILAWSNVAGKKSYYLFLLKFDECGPKICMNTALISIYLFFRELGGFTCL